MTVNAPVALIATETFFPDTGELTNAGEDQEYVSVSEHDPVVQASGPSTSLDWLASRLASKPPPKPTPFVVTVPVPTATGAALLGSMTATRTVPVALVNAGKLPQTFGAALLAVMSAVEPLANISIMRTRVLFLNVRPFTLTQTCAA